MKELQDLRNSVLILEQQKLDLEPIQQTDYNSSKEAQDSETAESSLPVKHSLLLKPNDAPCTSSHYTEETWAYVARKNLPKLLHNFPVTKAVLTKQGKGYLAFPDEKSRDTAVDTLKNDFYVEQESKVPKLLYPKITITGVV